MLSDTSLTILKKRYLLKDSTGQVVETPDQMFKRVARGISAVNDSHEYGDAWYHEMRDLRFLPNSPTLMNAGTGQGTLSACFVLPIEDTMEGIMDSAKAAAMVQKFGGGTGFALSRLRPKGASISSTHGIACGPIAVLRHLSSVSKLVTQGGKRDGANMAVMSVHHPDILEFIKCKQVEGDIHNFNISVGVTNKFMIAVEADASYSLINPATGRAESRVRARDVWNQIIDGAWRNGEPGMVFLDEINNAHSLLEIGTIEATNPCGEQPLLPNESCNLGSLVLSAFEQDGVFDYPAFARSIRLAVRFLDNVIDANKYATSEVREATFRTRKIGLGVMGWADLLINMGLRYGSPESLTLAKKIGGFLKDVADDASEQLAVERGAYPATLNGQFRNACRLTIAPTGTISMIADVSSGIEPLFALSYTKQNILATRGAPTQAFTYTHPMVGIASPEVLVTAGDISFAGHVDMQAAWQENIDSGVSKTINLPIDATRSDVARAYLRAWGSSCKGITVYRTGSRDKEVLVASGAGQDRTRLPTTDTESPNGGGLLEDCPSCGEGTVREEGCQNCHSCGWSAC